MASNLPEPEATVLSKVHFQLRSRADRRAKKARCSCGWEGPWRSTAPTGRRRRDARLRAVLIRADFDKHLAEEEAS